MSDEEVYEALHNALMAIGCRPGATVRGHTAITAAWGIVYSIQLGLLGAMEKGSDEIPGVLKPAPKPPAP